MYDYIIIRKVSKLSSKKINKLAKFQQANSHSFIDNQLKIPSPKKVAKYAAIIILTCWLVPLDFDFSEKISENFSDTYNVDFIASFFKWVIREFTLFVNFLKYIT